MVWSAVGLLHPIFLKVCRCKLITAEFHTFELFCLPSVHFEGPNKGNVNTEVAMNRGALVAQEDSYV